MENYLVYSDGRIYSKRYDRFLKPYADPSGYLRVDIAGKTLRVHRLVAQKFILNSYNLPQVDHIDGDKTNNDMTNLRWVSNLTNCQSINRPGPVGHWCINDWGNFKHLINIDGVTHIKTFKSFGEMQFYNLILKYCLYTKHRKGYENQKNPEHIN